jgi:hypothetical protein
MEIVKNKIKLDMLFNMSEKIFGDFVKAVVDVEKNLLAVDAELHADLEAFLLEDGAIQKNLWGINLYPNFFGTDDFVEFDSMINLRPNQGNRTRSVENIDIQKKIIEIVTEKVEK